MVFYRPRPASAGPADQAECLALPCLQAPVDLDQFPRFNRATPAQCILGAGEIVYIPRKWPHHAVALTDAVSITLNFCPTKAQVRPQPSTASRFLQQR